MIPKRHDSTDTLRMNPDEIRRALEESEGGAPTERAPVPRAPAGQRERRSA